MRQTAMRAYGLGSRRRDLAACALLLAVLLYGVPRLAVYYRATAAAVSVARVEPDGRRTPMPTPRAFWRGNTRTRVTTALPAAALDVLRARIEHITRTDKVFAAAPPGTRFEWTIRYSENTRRLDRQVVHVYPAPADGQD